MILASSDTLSVWKSLRQQRQHARALAADRFADFPDNPLDKNHRRRWCEQIRDGKAATEKLPSWRAFCRALLPANSALLFARLKARLIINAAGGVLENGGLCLDRTSGLPFIPGSSVKGCARRIAVAGLREWTQSHMKPSEPDEFKAVAESFSTPTEMLQEIAWVFGWGDQDWKSGRKPGKNGTRGELISDFEFACGEGQPWRKARAEVVAKLLARLGIRKREHPDEPWRDLPSFAGAVQFLPGFPWRDDPGIELDVVTPHHTAYYEGTLPEATDTEEPTPNVFPVVSPAKEPVFVFPLVRSPHATGDGTSSARDWLRAALTLLGIGGKTAAGYGWFESTPELDLQVLQEAEREAQQKEAEAARLRIEADEKSREEQERLNREEQRRLTASMTPEQRADFEMKGWDDNRLKNHFDRFAKLTPDQQAAICRLLRGPKAALWQELRRLAQEGKAKERSRWGTLTTAIFLMAKQHKEKMP
jgi:CRISPR/Cas system CMR subunit Cmr6 (Cas7 group RAMP superfamily)